MTLLLEPESAAPQSERPVEPPTRYVERFPRSLRGDLGPRIDRAASSIRLDAAQLRRGRLSGRRSSMGLGQVAVHGRMGRPPARPAAAVPWLGCADWRFTRSHPGDGHPVRMRRSVRQWRTSRWRTCRSDGLRPSRHCWSPSHRRTRASRASSPTANCWPAPLLLPVSPRRVRTCSAAAATGGCSPAACWPGVRCR